MSRRNALPTMEFYQDNTKLKWIILAVSIIISIGSIFYTNVLVRQLKERETRQVRLYAKALEYTLNDTENNILFITEEIIYKNSSIPTILVNEDGEFVYSGNLDIDPSWTPKKKMKCWKESCTQPLPLIEPVGNDQASPLLECRSKGGFLGHGLTLGVDTLVADLGILGPRRNQAPAKQDAITFHRLRIETNDRHTLRWGDVVVGLEQRGIVNLKLFRDDFQGSRLGEASTHQ